MKIRANHWLSKDYLNQIQLFNICIVKLVFKLPIQSRISSQNFHSMTLNGGKTDFHEATLMWDIKTEPRQQQRMSEPN